MIEIYLVFLEFPTIDESINFLLLFYINKCPKVAALLLGEN